MAYKVIDIEVVGEVYAEKLNAVGVKTTDDLLEKAATKKCREQLAEETGISEQLTLRCTNHSDLLSCHGFLNGLARVLKGRKEKYINHDGQFVKKPENI